MKIGFDLAVGEGIDFIRRGIDFHVRVKVDDIAAASKGGIYRARAAGSSDGSLSLGVGIVIRAGIVHNKFNTML
jgi:hypothetical protein